MRSRWPARRWVVALPVALVLLAVLGLAPFLRPRIAAGPARHPAASPAAPTSEVPSPAATPSHLVLALGDSVPSGAACHCRPFPETYGALLATGTGAHVRVDNRAVSGLATTGLIAQLGTPDVQAAVRRADVVLVTIGANDFGDHHDEVVSGSCSRGNADCVADELSALPVHLTSVLRTLRQLRQGEPTTILVTGYWNVFEDGDVARRAYGESGLQASLDLTRRANAVIAAASAAQGARYVDLFQPFEQSGRDVTPLMAADGDHPDAAGHALIARALLAAGLPQVS